MGGRGRGRGHHGPPAVVAKIGPVAVVVPKPGPHHPPPHHHRPPHHRPHHPKPVVVVKPAPVVKPVVVVQQPVVVQQQPVVVQQQQPVVVQQQPVQQVAVDPYNNGNMYAQPQAQQVVQQQAQPAVDPYNNGNMYANEGQAAQPPPKNDGSYY